MHHSTPPADEDGAVAVVVAVDTEALSYVGRLFACRRRVSFFSGVVVPGGPPSGRSRRPVFSAFVVALLKQDPMVAFVWFRIYSLLAFCVIDRAIDCEPWHDISFWKEPERIQTRSTATRLL